MVSTWEHVWKWRLCKIHEEWNAMVSVENVGLWCHSESEWLFLETRRGSSSQPGNGMQKSPSISQEFYEHAKVILRKELVEYGGFTLHNKYFFLLKTHLHPTITQQGTAVVLIAWSWWYPSHRHWRQPPLEGELAQAEWYCCCSIHGPVVVMVRRYLHYNFKFSAQRFQIDAF